MRESESSKNNNNKTIGANPLRAMFGCANYFYMLLRDPKKGTRNVTDTTRQTVETDLPLKGSRDYA